MPRSLAQHTGIEGLEGNVHLPGTVGLFINRGVAWISPASSRTPQSFEKGQASLGFKTAQLSHLLKKLVLGAEEQVLLAGHRPHTCPLHLGYKSVDGQTPREAE